MLTISVIVGLTIMVFSAAPVSAHLQNTDGPVRLWSIDPLTASLLGLVLILYMLGWFKLRRRAMTDAQRFRIRSRCFFAGWLTLLLALCSPIDVLGELLFSVHMVQHELLMLIAAPLLVISRPGSALLLGLPRPFRIGWGALINYKYTSYSWQGLVSPGGAWLLHAFGLWLWHIPLFFVASLESNAVHTLQHFSFLFIALIFWYAMFNSYQNPLGSVLYLFTTAIHASILGALITLSPAVWYSPYLHTTMAWGMEPLEDQQLGGIIMWMPAGLAFIGTGLYLMARYLRTGTPEHR